MMNRISSAAIAAILSLSFLVVSGCQNNSEEKTSLKGSIEIDGSSTVYPITAAVAEEFSIENRSVKVNVGFSGTGGGMKKFTAGTVPIANASRSIKQEEMDAAKKNNVEYVELKVAFDGLSVVVNKGNTWVKSLTRDQLKKMWGPDSKVMTWKDIDPSWPAEKIKFYSPGTDSGTFEYFTEAVNGMAKAMRTDITPSEDDNVLVKGVEGDKNAIGFFGYAYYEENKNKLKLVPVDNGDGKAVEPTFETIKNGTYKPLSRPLFVYVNKKSLAEPHIKAFLNYYLTEGTKLIKDVGYVALEDALYQTELEKLK